MCRRAVKQKSNQKSKPFHPELMRKSAIVMSLIYLPIKTHLPEPVLGVMKTTSWMKQSSNQSAWLGGTVDCLSDFLSDSIIGLLIQTTTRLMENWSWNNFCRYFLSTADLRTSRTIVICWQKCVHLVMVNNLSLLRRSKPAQEQCV